MNKIDWDLVSRLLDVAEGTRHYPKLKSLHDAALAELEKLASPPEKKQPEPTSQVQAESNENQVRRVI